MVHNPATLNSKFVILVLSHDHKPHNSFNSVQIRRLESPPKRNPIPYITLIDGNVLPPYIAELISHMGDDMPIETSILINLFHKASIIGLMSIFFLLTETGDKPH